MPFSRFRVGQRDAVGAALEAGGLLTEAKGPAETWRVGRLAWKGRPCEADSLNVDEVGPALGLTGEEVIARGGIVQTLRGGAPKIGNGCRFGPGP